MKKYTVHYTIVNGGDGGAVVNFYASKEDAILAGEIEDEGGESFSDNVKSEDLYFDDKNVLLNPEATKEQVAHSLAVAKNEEEENEDDQNAWNRRNKNTEALEKVFNRASMPKVALDKIALFYVIENLGSGEAGVSFYADKEAAVIAAELEDEGGEPFGDNLNTSDVLYFNDRGVLLNPDDVKPQLLRRLAEARGEDVSEEEDTYNAWDQKALLAKQFEKAAAVLNGDLSGKTVVFTGTFPGMTRAEAAEIAEKLGAKVSGSLSAKTDFLIVGEKAGSKLKKAQEMGVTVISDADWARIAKGRKPGAPGVQP
jgi:NAD-dependent DNA ligase